MMVTRIGTSFFVHAKKPIKKKNVYKNIAKVFTSVHGVRIKGITVRGNTDGKSGGISSLAKLKETKRKSLRVLVK